MIDTKKWLREARIAAKRTQAELGEHLGVGKSSISNVENGLHSLNLNQLIAASRYLRAGLPPELIELLGVVNASSATNVPLLELHELAHGLKIDIRQRRESANMVSTTLLMGRNAFALKQTGDAMEPKIPAGALVFVDPDKEVTNGSIVLALTAAGSTPLIRQLTIEGESRYLRPLNERYPLEKMPSSCQILGVAVQVQSNL